MLKTNLFVFTNVVSERDKTRLELLRLKFLIARLVEVKERLAELLHLFVADALRVTRQYLSSTMPTLTIYPFQTAPFHSENC